MDKWIYKEPNLEQPGVRYVGVKFGVYLAPELIIAREKVLWIQILDTWKIW